MEYFVVLICVTCGYLIQPTKKSASKGRDRFVQEHSGLEEQR
jgi:hypothetical protein